MIPEKIQAFFDFIDYLDSKKIEYIEKYVPICNGLNNLAIQRNLLHPNRNYRDKLLYDKIEIDITEKFQPITEKLFIPVTNKLRELGIWSGDYVFTSIWNNNIDAIAGFKRDFTTEEAFKVMNYKRKYLSFRKETNTNFICLQIALQQLDEILKELFDFFKDTDENEFAGFETKTIEVDSIEDAVKGFFENRGKNVQFSIPQESLFAYQNVKQLQPHSHNIKNEIVMGDKFQVGDVTNHSGQIIIGNDIKIADSFKGKNETADKITELIDLIRNEQNITDEQKQSLITNFDKVKEEVLEENPNKSKIFKWLSTTKGFLENLVLTHHVKEAIHWVYSHLNFIIH